MLPAVIASVAFRNYKALRGARLALQPFNLLIGPNGSGKTSLIEAVVQLRSLAKLPAVPPDRPSASRPDDPELVFTFSPPHDAIQVRLRCVGEESCDFLEVAPLEAPDWPKLQQSLRGIRSYHFEHRAMLQLRPQPGGAELAADGGNLATVLHQLQVSAPEAYGRLQSELVRIMPEFSGIEFNVPADAPVGFGLRLADGSDLVGAGDLSQGTLYTLGLLSLVCDPQPPPLVCIEEIDRGIHPRLLREIRDMLYRLSYPEACNESHSPVQVIATTHSPYLLDLFRDHPEEIVIAHKHGNRAGFARLVDRADLTELLSEGNLGDMWFSGILGGVPDEP
jgi:predicted ATPase